ncbi:hypothetical protein ACJZ2D_000735 [Fusarium nematophilum]
MALRKALAACAALALLGVEASRCQPHPSQPLSSTKSIVTTSASKSDAVSTSSTGTSGFETLTSTTDAVLSSTTSAALSSTTSEAASSTTLLSSVIATSSIDGTASTESISLSAATSETTSSATTLSTIVSATLSGDSASSVDTSTSIITTTDLPTTTVAASTTTTSFDACSTITQHVMNPGFDQATFDWTSYAAGYEGYTLPESSNDALSRPKSCTKFGVYGTNLDRTPRVSQQLRYLQYGRDYNFSFWWRTVSFNTNAHKCNIVPFVDDYALPSVRVQPEQAGQWVKSLTAFDVPAEEAKLEIRIWCEQMAFGPGGPTSFVAIIDDISVVKQ